MANSTTKDIVYSDFLANLDIHPTKRDIVRVVNEAAVKRSIRNLLLLNKEERFFRPNVGSGIRAYLFEPMTSFTATGLEQEIKQTLRNFEPRVSIIKVSVVPLYDQNSYSIRLAFYIINRPDPITYNVSLERAR